MFGLFNFSKTMLFIFMMGSPDSDGPNQPFPRNIVSTNGIQPTTELSVMNTQIQQMWESFESAYIIPHSTNQYRVLYNNSDDTVSEAIGYGMLFSVLMENSANNTQDVFDGLFRFYQNNLNPQGLMCWLVENNGTKRSTAATDADEDVAMALIFADRQWGSGGEINYLEEARTVVSNLAFIIRADNWFFPPADSGTNSTTEIEFRKDKVFNPSYFSPAWYREFYELTGDPVWTNCLAGSYSVIGGFLNTYTNGIVPDWCDPVTLGPCTIAPYNQQGYYNTYITNSTYCTLDYVMDYDGYRIGWRLGLDYLWNGDPLAQSNCTALARFMDETTAGRPNKINAYLPDGTRIVGSWNDLAYTAPVTVAAMADANGQAWLDTLCTSLTNDYTGTSFDKYFGRAQQLFAMLMLSGNFHNLGEESSPVVPPDPEPQPDPELIQNPGFVTDTTGWKLQSGPVHSSEYPGEDAGSVKMQGDDSYMYIEQKVESITPGQTYDFSASIYTENLPKGENATLKVQWGKADYSRHSDTWIDSTDTAGRSTLEGSATAPADAVRAFVICSLSGTSTGTVWFDNISMQEQ